MNRRQRLAILTATAVAIFAVSPVAHAQPGSFTVTPAFLSFQNQALNQASPAQQVTLANGSNVPVAISSIALTGSNPANFSFSGNCGASLAPLTSCQESVVFQPLSINGSSASLVVTDNAAGSPQTVLLFGTGNGAIVQISPGVITTVAGTGTAGFSGDNGPATAALLNNPRGVFLGLLGNTYFADSANNVIRGINPAGNIFTFTGNGTAGFSGDGGPATAAQLNSPSDITFDSAGNAYIADQQNQRIRLVSPQGIISTFAGTGAVGYTGDLKPASQATFNLPSSLAFDSFGNLVIADRGNNVLRAIDSLGIISTFAGTGVAGYTGDGGNPTQAALNLPSFVRCDQRANTYVADQGNHVVRVINNGDGSFITTFAGDGTAGSTGDGGPAISAELSNPAGLGLDQGGNLYIADSASNNVRKVDSAGVITTVAGNGSAGYTGDNGPATLAQLNGPGGIGVDLAGILYVADSLNNVVRKVGPAGALAFANTNLGQPSGAQLLNFVNIGTIPVTLPPSAQWTPTGTTGDYQIAGPCTNGPTLTPNASCALQVIFTPTAAGIRTLTYSIADSAVGGGQQVQFSGTGVAPSVLTLTAITPNSATLGSPATTITLTGTGFSTADVVQLNGTTIATTFVSATSLTAIVPVTFLAQPGTGLISVLDVSSGQTTTALPFTVIAPPLNIILTGPPTSPSAQQPILTFQLVNPYPAPLIGTLTLAFQPDPKVGVDDPSIQFSGGGRAFNFGIPANSTVTPTVQIQTGTVAGTAVISLRVTTNGVNITPDNLTPVAINIPEAAPVLNSATASRSGDMITISVQGFSNTREVTQAKFHFAGETFKNPDITIDVTKLFANWYSNENSLQFGSSFRYTQSFTLSSAAAKVKTVTVTLDNSIGTSTAIPAQ